MNYSDSIILSEGENFAVGHSNMTDYLDRPVKTDGGIIIICRSGSARVTVDMRKFRMCKESEMLILPGKILSVDEVSSDFAVEYVVFSRALFEEAGHRMDVSFFRYLAENPFYQHNQRTLERFERWLDTIVRLYDDRQHMFRDTIMRNMLQNVFMNVYDSLSRRSVISGEEHSDRHNELYHKYVALVRDNFREQHNVAFYAEQMCITTRYLSTIVRNVSGDSPKDIIDRMIILEMKILLRTTAFSIQEISLRLHFPDQSYMGRYFRKHTGESPSEYRNKK